MVSFLCVLLVFSIIDFGLLLIVYTVPQEKPGILGVPFVQSLSQSQGRGEKRIGASRKDTKS